MNDWMRDLATGKVEDLPDPFEGWEYQPGPEVGDVGVFSHPSEEMMEFGQEMAHSASETHMNGKCSSGCDPTASMNREEKRAFRRSLRKKGR